MGFRSSIDRLRCHAENRRGHGEQVDFGAEPLLAKDRDSAFVAAKEAQVDYPSLDDAMMFLTETRAESGPDNVDRRDERVWDAAKVRHIRHPKMRETQATLLLPSGNHVAVIAERLGRTGFIITLVSLIHRLPETQDLMVEALLNEPGQGRVPPGLAAESPPVGSRGDRTVLEVQEGIASAKEELVQQVVEGVDLQREGEVAAVTEKRHLEDLRPRYVRDVVDPLR